jgi:protein-S-isoprenylcysteine O-methyltransferase Ste14
LSFQYIRISNINRRMPLLLILKSALIATANGLTLLAICPPHVASTKDGDRMMEDVTSPERILASDRTPWMERLVVFGVTAYEIWSLRQGYGKIGGLPARIGELGAILAITGATLRLRCYQVLGRFFTFKVSLHRSYRTPILAGRAEPILIVPVQVAIRREHRLITGPFPYDLFRHPSYTGLVLMSIGLVLRGATSASSLHFPLLHQLAVKAAHWTTGFLASTFGIQTSSDTIKTIGTSGAGFLLIAGQVKVLNARVRVEEKALKEEFGGEYDRYCRKTWKFLPGW